MLSQVKNYLAYTTPKLVNKENSEGDISGTLSRALWSFSRTNEI